MASDAPWLSLQLPYICERMIGFSLPAGDQVAIVSYEGIHLLNLHQPHTVFEDNKHPEGGGLYDPRTGVLRYQCIQYTMLGLYGGSPIRKSTFGEKISLDLAGEKLIVMGPKAEVAFEFGFEDHSGDWGQATFSPDSQYILLGIPCSLHILKRAA